jgi:hypothetical protein
VAARTASAAFRTFSEPLQRVVSCFTQNRFLLRSGYDPSVDAEGLGIAGGGPILLENQYGETQLGLSIKLHYRIERPASTPGRWGVRTVAYVYRLEDAHHPQRQIAGFHWHPHIAGIPFPHVHAMDAPPATQRLHLPTGYVTLTDVLTFAMRDFAARPIRDDWEDALDKADQVLRESIGR